jgi:hypothetical protein
MHCCATAQINVAQWCTRSNSAAGAARSQATTSADAAQRGARASSGVMRASLVALRASFRNGRPQIFSLRSLKWLTTVFSRLQYAIGQKWFCASDSVTASMNSLLPEFGMPARGKGGLGCPHQ